MQTFVPPKEFAAKPGSSHKIRRTAASRFFDPDHFSDRKSAHFWGRRPTVCKLMLSWITRKFHKHIAQQVPNSLALCEFGCRVGQCSRGEWGD